MENYGFLKEKMKSSFVFLEVRSDKIFLTTNLKKDLSFYKIDLIHGIFTGLGYLTFVNNKITFSESGMIESNIYCPEYTFVGSHFVDTYNLNFKEFTVENNEIIKWIWYNLFSYSYDENVISHDGHISKFIHLFDLGIVLSLNTGLKTKMKREKANLENYGYIRFKSENKINLLEAISLYNRFQKFLFFFHGTSSQFIEFKYKCLSCNEWIQVFYNDKLSREKSSSFINLNYKDLELEIEDVLTQWYINNELLFCVDVILENLLTVKISHNRRFINSFFSFEAMVRRFSKLEGKNLTTKKHLDYYKDFFIDLGGIEKEGVNKFFNKIIRSRDYYVHSKKPQKSVFSEFELLYISFLLDYIVAIELLNEMKVSEKNIKKISGQARSTFIDGQTINKLLNENVFLQSKTNNE